MARGASKYTLIGHPLYRRGFSFPLLGCINEEESDYVIREVHEGAEADNKVILKGLQKRLEKENGRWVEELPQVLWSYHTTPYSTTNETPFRLTFGTEAVIPNEEELRANLDLLQEAWEIAHVREYAVKARVARRQDRKLVSRKFKCQDLVLQKIMRTADSNKLTSGWEGLFRVFEEVGRGAYQLEQVDGKRIPRTWNAANLRMYYS
ncbi:hypothetical protein CR513_09110, partial [Mucuna pruriens]